MSEKTSEKSHKPLAVIFDMDGVIFDTEPYYKYAWQTAADELGFELKDTFYTRFYGVNTVTCENMLIDHFGDAFPLPEFQARRQIIFDSEVAKGPIPVKAGFPDLLSYLTKIKK